MNNYENTQKRIAFLSIHRDLLGYCKQQVNIDAKGYEEICELAYVSMENLFKKYPYINGKINEKPDSADINKTEEIPL